MRFKAVYAVVRSFLAVSAVPSPKSKWYAPVSVMLPEPVIEAAGWMPTSPVMVVAPVLVMFGVPARTAKLCPGPSIGVANPGAGA